MHNVVGPTLVAMATTFGLFLHIISYKSACMADRPDVWAYQGVFWDVLFNGTMQNVVGPTLVAMSTKFGLGAVIQSPTGLLLLYYYYY